MDKPYVTRISIQQQRSARFYSEQEAAAASHLSRGAIRYLRTLELIQGGEIDGERRYSEEEVIQMRRVRRLQHDLGINLAGVEVILRLLRRLESLQQQLEQESNQGDRRGLLASEDPLLSPSSEEFDGEHR